MSTASGTDPRFRRRRGQAAVETMLLAFTVAIVLVAMVHLFTVTWAAENAHIRAREAVLHGNAYLTGTRADGTYTTFGQAPFDPGAGNYRKAEYGVPVTFQAGAQDQSRDDMIGADSISVQATIPIP